MRKKYTYQQIAESIIKYWQPQLRLQNWKFSVKIIDDVDKLNCFAQNKQDPAYETSYIEVLNPQSIPDEWKGTRDLEVTILHEMLHTRLLYVAPIPKKKKKTHNHYQVEMAVETLSKALVANRRGVDPEDLK